MPTPTGGGMLSANPAFATLRATIAGKSRVTLLYSSHDREHNNAVVVQDMLSHE